MSQYSLSKYEIINGKEIFYELLKDGRSLFEEFKIDITGNKQYESEFRTILAYMQMVADLKRLPAKKFKNITPQNDIVKEFELKSKHLRVYFIHQEKLGKVIILGGYKDDQKDHDIKRLRAIKKDYLTSINIKK